jgi:anti-sigma B factor antagonist
MAPQSARPEFSVAAVQHDGHMVLTLRGDIDLLTAPQMDDAIAAALRIHPYTLVMDMSAVTFMDSSACRSLVRARTDAIRSAVELELRDITAAGRRALEILELDKLFTFTLSEDGYDTTA